MKTNIEIEAMEKQARNDNYRLQYHLMPPIGWLNDPNGSCQFKNTYHFFYQYAPTNPLGATKYWGHYTSKDLCTYQKQPVAIFPDSKYDKDGVYSGGTYIENDTMYIFYTGNVKHPGNHDYILTGREHNTMLVTSKDGITFSEKRCLLTNAQYPSDVTVHVRDPQVIKKENHYYMFLGARTKEDIGCCLIYISDNLYDWTYFKRLESKETLGYMWECPSFVEINNTQFLICCPQGVNQQGYQYEALYQNGYFIIHDDFRKECTLSSFIELDYGFDYYANQVFINQQGNPIMMGWMGLPDVEYTNPTVATGWQHALALPRVLSTKDKHLYQYPIEETKALRKSKQQVSLQANQTFTCTQNTFELHIYNLEAAFKIHLFKDAMLEYSDTLCTFTMATSGCGRTSKHIEIDSIKELVIFRDTSSLEIFINHGQKVLTTRIYDAMTLPTIVSNIDLEMTYYELGKYIVE